MPGIEEIAAELYAGPPSEFVAARNAQAKAADDTELSARIRALRKPSTAAWVVNRYARERAEQLGEALQLAEELREAQADLDAAALAQLSRQRRALTTKLAADAAELAQASGTRITDATREAVAQTISAAFFDPAAAAAVASGRLVHDLEPSPEFPLDLEEAVGGGAPGPRARRPAPVDEVKARRELRKAQSALHDAEQAHVRAERQLATADRAVRDAKNRETKLQEEIARLEADLAAARKAADTARDHVGSAEEQQVQASDALATAEAELESARRAVESAKG